MLKRLVLGVVKGSLVGGLVAYALVAGLSVGTLTGGFAYGAVVLAGVLTALIAGRPAWASGARIEVLLKTIAATFLSCGFLFFLARYFSLQMDLGALGSGKLVELPYILLPTVSMLLAVFFELDNDGSSADDTDTKSDAEDPRVRIGSAPTDESLIEAGQATSERPTRAERR